MKSAADPWENATKKLVADTELGTIRWVPFPLSAELHKQQFRRVGLPYRAKVGEKTTVV